MHSSLIQIARNILFESTPKETRFSADYTDPDGLEFDMSRDEKDAIDYYYISFDDAYCAFCFIGPNDGTMVYIKNAANVLAVAFKWTRNLGVNRNRGLGRCKFILISISE